MKIGGLDLPELPNPLYLEPAILLYWKLGVGRMIWIASWRYIPGGALWPPCIRTLASTMNEHD